MKDLIEALLLKPNYIGTPAELARKCPIQVMDDVFSIFNTYREPDTAICNTEFLALACSQVAM